VGGSLGRYKSKRNFSITIEPEGGHAVSTDLSTFVIHKHAARNLHYDLRLELDGTLKSWAVPKGPSLDPSVKRLAVHVEDHPIEYGSFEGNIPAGEYGAGAVIIWDHGTWSCLNGEADEQYKRGSMKFKLNGQKLQGGWMLVKIKGKPLEKNKENWLLRKEQDEHARDSFDILSSMPESSISGLTIEETKISQRSSEEKLTAILVQLKEEKVPKALALPHDLKPQLATLARLPPDESDWLHEIKYDGYRLLAHLQESKVRLITRNGHDWTAKYPSIASALQKLSVPNSIIDGELVVLLPNGKSSFHELQNYKAGSSVGLLVFFVFDLPFFKGFDLRKLPLKRRKEILQAILPEQSDRSELRFSSHVEGGGRDFYEEICKMSLEGSVSKKSTSHYASRRSSSWLKTKCINSQEFVLCGFTYESNSRSKIGALLLGSYSSDRKLRYVGKAGTGYKETERKDLHKRLKTLKLQKPPVTNPPDETGKVVWTKPKLLAEIKFAEITPSGVLRHAVFQGLREDKTAKELKEEETIGAQGGEAVKEEMEDKRQIKKTPSTSISSPNKVLYPDDNITKLDLASYYKKVAPYILSDIKSRPLVLIRCPKGIEETCFFQKHVNESFPKDMPTVEVEPKASPYAMVQSVDNILTLAQLSVIEVHSLGAGKQDLKKPDRIIFDLDPDEGLSSQRVVEAALLLKELLDHLGLASFVKLTGGKGVHIVAPLNRRNSWSEVKTFSAGIAAALVASDSKAFTASMAKRARKDRIFIDHFRNAEGSSAIANYSPRARPGAPVATPIRWEELKGKVAFNKYNLRNIGKRLAALKEDPWHDFKRVRQSLKQGMFKELGLQ